MRRDINGESCCFLVFRSRGYIAVFRNIQLQSQDGKLQRGKLFPPEREARDMRIMVGASYGKQAVTDYDCIYFR